MTDDRAYVIGQVVRRSAIALWGLATGVSAVVIAACEVLR